MGVKGRNEQGSGARKGKDIVPRPCALTAGPWWSRRSHPTLQLEGLSNTNTQSNVCQSPGHGVLVCISRLGRRRNVFCDICPSLRLDTRQKISRRQGERVGSRERAAQENIFLFRGIIHGGISVV